MTKVTIRQFNANNDYSDICEWWEQWEWPIIPISSLPTIGAIAENEGGVKICAAWLYRTDSDMCWIDWYISNKNAEKKDRANGLDGVIEYLCHRAKDNGFRVAFASVGNPHLIKRLQNASFILGDYSMKNLTRVL